MLSIYRFKKNKISLLDKLFFIFRDSNRRNEDIFTVALGVYDRCDPKESTRKIFNVSKVYVHEEYRDDGKFHDIAVMTLNRFADYTTACLPVQGLRDMTEPALLIGFGITEEGANKEPCHMMEANILKYSKNDCKNSDLPREDSTEPTVICAGTAEGGIDSCQVTAKSGLKYLEMNKNLEIRPNV